MNKDNLQKGKIVIISAPSGSGKTTICHELRKRLPDVEFSVSATTRQQRKNEVNKEDYIFISEQEFKEKIKSDYFAEWAIVYDHYYGTPANFLNECLKNGKTCLLDIDIQGGLNIKKKYPEAISIFIILPSLEELEKRLRARNTDSDENIKLRLSHFQEELKFKEQYDYIVVNDVFEDAIKEIIEIINESINIDKVKM